MTHALDVAGQLAILADGHPLQVDFRGDVIAVVLPDRGAALALGRMLPRSGREAQIVVLQQGLARAGLVLEIWIGSRRVARLSDASRAGRLTSWLGLGPMEISLRPLLASLVRRASRS